MELKTTLVLKKKDKLVKKLKARFGEGTIEGQEDYEEEEQQYSQGPLSLTQGMGEDEEEECVEEEEAKEAPAKLEPKKSKASTQPLAKPKSKKVAKPSPAKPTTPTRRATTRATTQKALEKR